jgi:hypothetical protein
MATEGALGMAAGAFPQFKAFAVAQGMIQTYYAAIKAYAEGGPYLGPFLAAMVVAAGMMNIAKIESTEPGSGGGGGGRMSAPSMSAPPSYGGGAGGSAPASVTHMTTNQPTANTYNVYALDTNNALRTLETKRRPASRMYDHSIGNRPSTTIGSKR